MIKKKQVKFLVSIPYELRENKLWMQTIVWPDQCPCCGSSTQLGKFEYFHQTRYSQVTTGTQTTTTSYPLVWEVPYCLECQEHAQTATSWKYGIIGICLFVPLILWLAIDAPPLLLYALFIVGGLVLYKIIVETVVKSKLKPTCLDYSIAFWASSPPTDEHRIIFNFDMEAYARRFAELNQAELEFNE